MFLVCGEALMDVFAGGDTPTGMVLDARVGGSPFNVAVGLARLAQPVALLGAVSSGFLGERLVTALRGEGVATDTVARVDAPTTLSVVGLDASGVPSYAFYGERGADRQLDAPALAAVPAGLLAIHLGSYTTVVQPIADTLRSLVEQRRDRTTISFDPNIRLNVEPNVAIWRDTLQWMLPRSHLLKISEDDLGLLLPGETPQAFAAHALALGVRLVVVTRGGDGALGWTASAQASVPTPSVEVVDTVGAGDTFQAAMLTWLAEHDALAPAALAALSPADLDAALRFAAGAAAITCSRRGADMPRRHELPGAPR